jgi:trans-L-3-hydroxyproline dehydratase
MYGAILTAPSNPAEADVDVFFINTHGYSPMCGHAILAIAKICFDTGLVDKKGQENQEIRMTSPVGMVYARATFDSATGEVARSTFRNVLSFVYKQHQTVAVPDLGDVTFDISFGGAFYVFVSIDTLPPFERLEIILENYSTFTSLSRRIRKAILNDPNIVIQHPVEPDLSELFGVIFTGPPHDPKNHSRNVNVFEDGEVGRSPTGTGVSARAALHFARGEIAIGEVFTVESIVGSTMTGKVVKEVNFEGFEAVIPEVGGRAHIMSRTEFFFDQRIRSRMDSCCVEFSSQICLVGRQRTCAGTKIF